MLIIDCFIFYNELDMLNYRLNLLDDYVDYFVLVESKYTHVGKEKELYYENNKELYKKFNDKIIHIIVEDVPYKFEGINYNLGNQWTNEEYHRNQIKLGINKLNLNDEDIIILSDLDEIPNTNLLYTLKNDYFKPQDGVIYWLEQDLYYYNLKTYIDIGKWDQSKLLNYTSYKLYSNDNITKNIFRINHNLNFINCDNYKMLKNGGWHLSYFGDEKFIKNKLEGFIHQEYNNDYYVKPDRIRNCIENTLDLFDRPWVNIKEIKIEDNKNLPHRYKEFLTKYI